MRRRRISCRPAAVSKRQLPRVLDERDRQRPVLRPDGQRGLLRVRPDPGRRRASASPAPRIRPPGSCRARRRRTRRETVASGPEDLLQSAATSNCLGRGDQRVGGRLRTICERALLRRGDAVPARANAMNRERRPSRRDARTRAAASELLEENPNLSSSPHLRPPPPPPRRRRHRRDAEAGRSARAAGRATRCR